MVIVKCEFTKEDHELMSVMKKNSGLCLSWREFFLYKIIPEKYDPLFNKDISSREKAIMNVIIGYQKIHSTFAERLSVHDTVLLDFDTRMKNMETGDEKSIDST